MRRLSRISALLIAIALLTSCAAGRAFSRGEKRARVGDWDAAVTYYQQAVQHDPGNPDYKIALERATLNASRVHFDTARQLELKDQLDAALIEYKRAADFDPGNRTAGDKQVALEKIIRDRIEASRPKAASAQLRDQARLNAATPELNPASRLPIKTRFTNASVRDILTFISNSAGINIVYDSSFQDKQFTVDIDGTLEQVLNTVLSANQAFFTVQDDHTIVVAADTNANHQKYDRLIAVTFPISYADTAELMQMLTTITRLTASATIAPIIQVNPKGNSITVRATQPVMDVIRQLIASNDKPHAEVTLDVEILEVNRSRAKQVGLNLSAYQVQGIFSPDQAPPGAVGATGAAGSTTDNRPFNLNTISQGVSTADFYTTLPQIFVRFLETDTRTKVLLKTTLRGAEGAQISLHIGADEPYLNTTYSPIATGGANVNPLASYAFRPVGITLQGVVRVTDEEDILITPLTLQNSALGPTRSVGGSPAPSFTTREVTTNIRLRDGESHLMAGLLQDDDRKTLKGFPGLMSVKFFREIFSDTDATIQQTDIVMLLTPRVIRGHEYTASDLAPINLGTNANFGLTGPPPLIAAPPEPAPQVPTAPPGMPPQGIPVPTVPQGGAPGQVTTPAVPQQPPPTTLQSPPPTTLQQPSPQASAVGPLGEPQINAAAPQTAPTGLRPAAAQISLTAPTGDVRVAAGPYLVPVYVTGASRMSTVTLTVTFNPGVLRVRQVQEGTFLRQGGAIVASTNKVDATLGRVDLTFVRTGDTVGATGAGVLSGVMFDAIGTGTSQMTVSGVATDPGGASLPLQFAPVSIVVR
jgi:general secretion pathway protein D